MFTPAEAIAMQCETPEILSKADMAGQTERRGTVSKASLVQVAICADDHFVYLQGQRPAPTSPWELLYVDSWPVEKPVCRAAAENVARYLGMLPGGVAFPHSLPGLQADGWSCGLWVLQEQEHQLRKLWKQEPITSKPSLKSILHRLNDFVSRVSPAAKKSLGPVDKASDRIWPKTIQEAYQAALSCSKCHTTKVGHKGCSQCMGPLLFSEARDARKDLAPENCLGVCVCVCICVLVAPRLLLVRCRPFPATAKNAKTSSYSRGIK